MDPVDNHQTEDFYNDYAARKKGEAQREFKEYQNKKSSHTIIKVKNDLVLLNKYLKSINIELGDMLNDISAWGKLTKETIAGFIEWQLGEGYALGSIQAHLRTITKFTRLAWEARILSFDEYIGIHGEQQKFRENKDEFEKHRISQRIQTRKSTKKAIPLALTPEQASQLISQSANPQGRRDSLLMAIFLDHGLRVSEVARLEVSDFDLETARLRFYRSKVDRVQTHRMTVRTYIAFRNYLENDAPLFGIIWRASLSGRDNEANEVSLTHQGMTIRAITKRVQILGDKIGIERLSPNDCRHYWANQAGKSRRGFRKFWEDGGWTDWHTALRLYEFQEPETEEESIVLNMLRKLKIGDQP
jgi:integrase